ncbi:MAG: tetratricopeptide repeat protein [Lewinellaceae bacterium]|nr:tetratricopeptide repeat protein [Saprospiraceae bacterium]MCB9345245.1 tetratricopeptide repeat protein [Lewinellaceae bacterium]
MRTLLLAAFTFFISISISTDLQAQDPNLANQYFVNGEYEKASALYVQLYERDKRSDYYFTRYVDCLLNLEQYDECEKVIKKQIKSSGQNNSLYVTYGNLFEKQNKEAEAEAQYKKAIEKMDADYASVERLARLFTSQSKFDYALETYEKGAELTRDKQRFAFNIGELYRRKGETTKMIEAYLNALGSDPGKLVVVQTRLAQTLTTDDYAELQTQLYNRVQNGSNPDYIEILAWSFVIQKDFQNALRQYKALDKRLGENGQRIMNLANDAAEASDYDAAIAGYEYIIDEKGQMSPFFYDAKKEIMECRRKKITEGYTYTIDDLKALETEYETFLQRFGKSTLTANLILQLANLEAYYMQNLSKAIYLLEELKSMPGLNRTTLAETKIQLGDFYLINGDIWESTLLYSQVDKDFKEETIGQEARFKNARLAYFNGDFQWAQAQFDVLKASTSKLISNDALDLSVFIMDNLNLDTSSAAISLYSGAELLVYQNRFDEAFLKLDTLRSEFPDHSLQDDILYLEAQIYAKKRDWEKAAKLYQEIVDKFPEEIRADNALFALAQIYETRLPDLEKAKELYERIFMEYSGSIFAVEARKEFRVLRGDKVQ